MRKLMWFSIGFCAACLLAAYLLDGEYLLSVGLCAAAAAVLSRLLLPRVRILFAAALGLCVGMLWFWAYDALLIRPAQARAGYYEAADVLIVGYPQKTQYGYSVDADLSTGEDTARLRLYLNGDDPGLGPGDVLTFTGTLRRSDRAKDGSAYYYDISRGITLVGNGKILELTKGDKLPLRAIPLWISEQMKAAIRKASPEDAAPFLTAILTGDRTYMPNSMQQDLRTSGLSHVIAVSGMHVSILMGALYLVLGRGRKRDALIGIPLLLFFALMTGMSASVVRASVMLSLFLLAPLFRREPDAPTLLSAAGILILLQNPWAVTDVSFQLSFLAMTGLLLFADPLYQHFRSHRPWSRLLAWKGIPFRPAKLSSLLLRGWKALTRGVLAGLCASVSALSLTLPLTALLYGTVSTYAVLANLLTLWAVAFCFVGGMLTTITALLWLPLGRASGWLTAWPVRYILLISRWISGLPMSSLPVSSLYTKLFLLAAYLLVVLFLLFRRKRYGLLLLTVAACLAVTALLIRLHTRVDHFTVTVLDVGQGQCVCVRTDDFNAMIDCGGSDGDAAGAYAARYLQNAGVDTLDALILTHYDRDHVGGVEELLRKVDVRTLYLEDVPFDEEVRLHIEETALTYGAEICYVTSDRTLTFSAGSMTIYAPVADTDDNAASLAVLFAADDFTMLVTGDMDIYAENKLLASHELPALSLLVVGHHGSYKSTGPALLRKLRPESAAISVGSNNYGHPAQEVLDRLEKYGVTVYRTDVDGDIEIRR